MTPAEYRHHLRERLVASRVPYHLWEGLVEYLAERRPMGGFLTAVVTNDLMEACTRADPSVRPHIADVVLFLVSYAPAHAWGSDERVGAWLADPAPVILVPAEIP
jgi:hypothetical protein